MLPDWLSVIILGIVQGITEFLPISSTGHLLIASALLDFGQNLGGTFEIFIQIGSVIAVIVFYRADLWQQIRRAPSEPATRRFWLNLAIAFVPAGAIGFLLRDAIRVLFNPDVSSRVVAVALILGGLVFLVIERRRLGANAATTDLSAVTMRQALIIGCAQVTALIPGVSRSGASIVGGMLAGLDRRTATQFSFYLAIPTLGIATVFDLLTNLDRVQPNDLVNLLLGAAVTAVVSWVAMGWLLRYVSRNSFAVFGYYRILAGVVILVLIAATLL